MSQYWSWTAPSAGTTVGSGVATGWSWAYARAAVREDEAATAEIPRPTAPCVNRRRFTRRVTSCCASESSAPTLTGRSSLIVAVLLVTCGQTSLLSHPRMRDFGGLWVLVSNSLYGTVIHPILN